MSPANPENIGLISSKSKSGIEIVQFKLQRGISYSSIQQLIRYSTEDLAVADQTSDPKRFANMEAFEKWLNKKRFPYTTVDQDLLAGIIWFGSEQMPPAETIDPKFDPKDYGITFAIRLYEAARGRGLAVPFMNASFEDFMKTLDYKNLQNQNFWLETSITNIPAVKAYENFGFQQATTRPDEHGRIIMIHKP